MPTISTCFFARGFERGLNCPIARRVCWRLYDHCTCIERLAHFVALMSGPDGRFSITVRQGMETRTAMDLDPNDLWWSSNTDVDHDGDVDLADFAAFRECMGN